MANNFAHVELNTTDVAKAKDFYTKLFKWELEDFPQMNYTVIKTGTPPGGGLFKHPAPEGPSFWLVYINVDDIVGATNKAKSLGAKLMKDITEVPGMGRFSILTDPTGAAFALWQNA